mmetsp:Transcript_15589/g.36772  ORF Transcript_15589/g.36772 Transcript_15589/m.36772 type:complete len:217 (+) Transcript_15589:252-902(+)
MESSIPSGWSAVGDKGMYSPCRSPPSSIKARVNTRSTSQHSAVVVPKPLRVRLPVTGRSQSPTAGASMTGSTDALRPKEITGTGAASFTAAGGGDDAGGAMSKGSGMYQVPTEGLSVNGPSDSSSTAPIRSPPRTDFIRAVRASSFPAAGGAAGAGVGATKCSGSRSAGAWGSAGFSPPVPACRNLHMNSTGSSGFILRSVRRHSDRRCSMPCFAR